MPYEQQLRDALAESPTLPEAPESPLSGALRTGRYGALIGAGLGALRAGLSRPEEGERRPYLRDTLAGALLGSLAAGGTAYLSRQDPFTRGTATAKAFEAGRDRLAEGALDPHRPLGSVAGDALQAGLAEFLSGEHDFTPEEQRALVQQFVKAELPTTEGWRRRTQLARRAADRLQMAPEGALRDLVHLQQVAPDEETRTFANEAVAQIRSGRARTAEGRHALASIARELAGRAEAYAETTPLIDSLNVMKEMYGAGQMPEEDVAKHVGLLTGRFGAQTESAQRLRRMVQDAVARPVTRTPPAPYPRAPHSRVSDLIARARQR